jgi:uncharacterized integral membrane protein
MILVLSGILHAPILSIIRHDSRPGTTCVILYIGNRTIEEEIMNTKLLITLFLIALAAIFIVQNVEVVEVRFLFWKMAMSRALMFVFLVLIGVATGWLLRGHTLRKSKKDEIKLFKD